MQGCELEVYCSDGWYLPFFLPSFLPSFPPSLHPSIPPSLLLPLPSSNQPNPNLSYETTGSARTLEFRQHAGTLCPLAIAHWTTLVVAMVRLAEHNGRMYGSGSGYGGEGYRIQEVEEGKGSSVWELMEDMELGRKEVQWWRGIVARR